MYADSEAKQKTKAEERQACVMSPLNVSNKSPDAKDKHIVQVQPNRNQTLQSNTDYKSF